MPKFKSKPNSLPIDIPLLDKFLSPINLRLFVTLNFSKSCKSYPLNKTPEALFFDNQLFHQ